MSIKPCTDFIRAELEPARDRLRNGVLHVSPQPVRIGRALAVGPGKRGPNGRRRLPDVKPGERFAFFMAVTETKNGRALTERVQRLRDGQIMVRETDILFVIEAGEVEVEV